MTESEKDKSKLKLLRRADFELIYSVPKAITRSKVSLEDKAEI